MSDEALKHCVKHRDGRHQFGDRLLFATYSKCDCGVRREETDFSLLPPIPEMAKAPDKLAEAMEALALLVAAKRLKDVLETCPSVADELTYKGLKTRGWALAFQIVDQHKKDKE